MSNTCRQFTFNLSALDSGEHSGVAYVDWWDNFWEPVALPYLRDGCLSCCLLGLQSPQIKFSNEAAMCEKTRQPYTSQTFAVLEFPETLLQANSRPSQPSRVLKAQLRALLISSLLSRLFLWWATLLDTSSPSVACLHRYCMNSVAHIPTALINSFVLPSAHLFPQTNCRQKHLC